MSLKGLGQLFRKWTTIIKILRDFKPILDLDLYGEHVPEERITGSKIDLDLSAGSTCMQVYIISQFYITSFRKKWCQFIIMLY